MKVLVVGSGGREHALCRKLAQSRLCTGLVCAPGNPGIERIARAASVKADDVVGLVALARAERFDLVVVGPEAPLSLGLADRLAEAGIACFGPSRAAAEIEASKAFAKEVMARAGIPTAAFGTFDDASAARSFAAARGGRVAVKADGLAAGKGVIVCSSEAEAASAIDEILVQRSHGAAGARIVVEEKLEGEEASVIALADGTDFVLLSPAQDHKRVGEGDTGPNTGGMGAYSPAPVVTNALLDEVGERVIAPALRELSAMGRPFTGALYAGLMIGADGPKVIEFNARLGDPETQAILARLDTDLLPALLAAARGGLRGGTLAFRPEAAVTVVLAAAGYPGKVRAGDPIEGLDDVPDTDEFHVLHAGTARKDGRIVTSGGRVLSVTALGPTVREARERAYAGIDRLHFEGMHFRRDIGARALAREGGGGAR